LKIALDAVGGDFGLAPNIEGAIQAANEFGIDVILVGPEQQLRADLSSKGISGTRFEVVDAPELVGMDEEPAAACRAKPKASIMVCAELVAQGKAAGYVSAGHSGATMVAALWHLPGVLRPAIAVPIPTPKGVTILLDAGANVDCKPWHLVQFAQMGGLLATHGYGIASPTVGVLTIGEEEGKGNDLVKESFPLLKAEVDGFKGCVEGRDVPAGTTDVVVCDGFVGNVLIKTMEGTAKAMMNLLKDSLMSSWRYKLPALLLRGPFARLKKKMSYDEYGGAPLVGVRGSVIVCHGSSNAKAIANALRMCRHTAQAKLDEKIAGVVERPGAGAAPTEEAARKS
jgi:phosphate acyltransferase